MINTRIGELIYKVLSLDTELQSMGVTTYPLVAVPKQGEQEPPYPFITYRRTNTNIENTIAAYEETQYVSMLLSIYTTDYEDSLTIVERVITLLNRQRFNSEYGNVNEVLMTNLSEDYNEWGFIQNLSIQLNVE